MRFLLKLSDEKINEIKTKISGSSESLRKVAGLCGVSYYTVWCISKGKYDHNEPLQPYPFRKQIVRDGMFQHENTNWLI